MELLTQDGSNCSQTCIAMVSGLHPRNVEELTKTDNTGGLKDTQVIEVCKKIGIPIIGIWTNERTKWDTEYPPDCFMIVRCLNYGKYTGRHMIVRLGNMFYDPNGMKYYHLPNEFEKQYLFDVYLKFKTVTVEYPAVHLWGDKVHKCTRYHSRIICNPPQYA